jgi:hypothetical protein
VTFDLEVLEVGQVTTGRSRPTVKIVQLCAATGSARGVAVMWRRTVALLAVLVVLAGCYFGCDPGPLEDTRADLTTSDVVGDWVDHVKGGVLTFVDDGAFTATTLPYQLLSSIDPALLPPGFRRTDPLPAMGTWQIERPIGQSDGPHSHVRLDIDEIAGQPKGVGLDLLGQTRDAKIILFFTIGDPDSNVGVDYQKCDGPCVLPSGAPTAPASPMAT